MATVATPTTGDIKLAIKPCFPVDKWGYSGFLQ